MLSALEDSGQARLCEVGVGERVVEVYNYFADRLHTGQVANTLIKQQDHRKISLNG